MKKGKLIQSVLVFCFIMILFLLPTENAKAGVLSEVPEESFVQTDGTVHDIEFSDDGVMYMAGKFTRVALGRSYGIPVSAESGNKVAQFPRVNAAVRASESDGKGGWFIGGDFTKVGSVVRNHIAHILPDGTVDLNWDANSKGTVNVLKLEGNTLYVGGWFNPPCGWNYDPTMEGESIGGAIRNKIAALDATTGRATSWNPNLPCSERCGAVTVSDIVVTDTVVYAAGDFYNLGGASRRSLVALSRSTGAATSWNPQIDGSVFALELYGDLLYVGGGFESIGGVSRTNLAAININTGVVASWNPNPQNNLLFNDYSDSLNDITSIERKGSVLYVGGTFKTISEVERHNLAAFDLDTGTLTDWDPSPNYNQVEATTCSYENYGYVADIEISDSTAYISGSFYNIGGECRKHIAEVNLSNGTATDWDPHAWEAVETIASDRTNVYLGGHFLSVGGERRNSMAAFDTTSNTITSWNPDVTVSTALNNPMENIFIATVYDMELSADESLVYAGGHFAEVGGIVRNGVSAIRADTGVPTSWNPNLTFGDTSSTNIDSATGYLSKNGWVFDLELSSDESIIYTGGFFTMVGSAARVHLAALSTTTGNATDWNPNTSNNGSVRVVEIDGNSIYVGGNFTTFGNITRNRIAEFDISSGMLTDWNPNVAGIVHSIGVTDSTVYLGGGFNAVGGQARNYIAAVERDTGTVTPWAPTSIGYVRAIYIAPEALYAGGEYYRSDGLHRSGAGLDYTTGNPIWVPELRNVIYDIEKVGSKLYIAGHIDMSVFDEYDPSLLIEPDSQDNDSDDNNDSDDSAEQNFLSSFIENQFFAYSKNLRGGFNIASGNVLDRGEAEIIVGAGNGFGPQVRIFNSQGELQTQFWAYASHLRSGVRVAVGDVNGDGINEIITSPGPGGSPHIRIFKGNGELFFPGFFALDGKFKGGVYVSGGDTDGDGVAEIVVSAGKGGGPHIMVYSVEGRVLSNFMAYDQDFRGGIKTTLADIDGDGKDEIITGPEVGAPHIQIFQIRTNEIKRLSPGFYAFNPSYRGGVSLAGVDVDGNGKKEIVVSTGNEAQPLVKIYNVREQLLRQFYVYATSFIGGVNISGGDVDYDGADELIVIPRSSGGPQVRIINVDAI